MSLANKNDRVKLHRKHRFNLAFEATNEKDYMTEVIFDSFQSGSLPVILGPSNIEDHFPPNSFINAGRFQYWDDLGKYVKQVSENKTLWESYFEWRKDPKAHWTTSFERDLVLQRRARRVECADGHMQSNMVWDGIMFIK